MFLEDQVCSLELAKRLKELGVKKGSILVWEYCDENCYGIKFIPYAVVLSQYNNYILYPAYTVAELGEMLPLWHEIAKRENEDWICTVREKNSTINHHSFAEKESDARAKMLIYLLENKII